MIKTYRFRVYPTDEQKAALSCSFGSVRYVYNAALAYRCKAYERRGESISYCGTVKFLNKLKAAKPWLREAYSQSLQYPQGVKADFQRQMLYFPKTGWVSCVFHRCFKGGIRTVTLRKEKSGAYYASVLVDDGKKAEDIPAGRNVESESDLLGIDMGIKTLATCSDGTSHKNGKYLSKSEKRLKKEQRNLSRKKKGSKNRAEQRIKVARIHERILKEKI